MAQPLAFEVIEKFDDALNQHMRTAVGADWRTKCHLSANIAARALNMLFPQANATLTRVEMIATMKGADAYVHFGDPNNSAKPGMMPAHFAVTLGSSVYDPAFAQLQKVNTPLELSAFPFFYQEGLLKFPPKDYESHKDFHWSSIQGRTNLLLVGYKRQPAPLPEKYAPEMWADGRVRKNARQVANLFR